MASVNRQLTSLITRGVTYLWNTSSREIAGLPGINPLHKYYPITQEKTGSLLVMCVCRAIQPQALEDWYIRINRLVERGDHSFLLRPIDLVRLSEDEYAWITDFFLQDSRLLSDFHRMDINGYTGWSQPSNVTLLYLMAMQQAREFNLPVYSVLVSERSSFCFVDTSPVPFGGRTHTLLTELIKLFTVRTCDPHVNAQLRFIDGLEQTPDVTERIRLLRKQVDIFASGQPNTRGKMPSGVDLEIVLYSNTRSAEVLKKKVTLNDKCPAFELRSLKSGIFRPGESIQMSYSASSAETIWLKLTNCTPYTWNPPRMYLQPILPRQSFLPHLNDTVSIPVTNDYTVDFTVIGFSSCMLPKSAGRSVPTPNAPGSRSFPTINMGKANSTPPPQSTSDRFQPFPARRGIQPNQPARASVDTRPATVPVYARQTPSPVQPSASSPTPPERTPNPVRKSAPAVPARKVPRPQMLDNRFRFVAMQLPEPNRSLPGVDTDTQQPVVIRCIPMNTALMHSLVGSNALTEPHAGNVISQLLFKAASGSNLYLVHTTVPNRFSVDVAHPSIQQLSIEKKLILAANMVQLISDLVSAGVYLPQFYESHIFIDPDALTVCLADGYLLTARNIQPMDCTLGYASPAQMAGQSVEPSTALNYALSVWLFRLFVGGFPLEGSQTQAVLSESIESEARLAAQLYGVNACFCLDPEDSRNALGSSPADQARKQAWCALPASLRIIFVAAFSEHLHHAPEKAPNPEMWVTHLNLAK